MKKMTVIGYFGENGVCQGGQSIKTVTITKALTEIYGSEQVVCLKTSGKKKDIIKAPFFVLKALAESTNVIIMPASNGLRLLTPLLAICNLFFRRTIHYVVIGGWLPEFVSKRRLLKKRLRNFNYIYVETILMKKVLEEEGFHNIVVMPNCKDLKIIEEKDIKTAVNEPIRLCTFSRVMKEKGIEDAIEAVEAINNTYGKTVLDLDIYGQVDENQTDWFDRLKTKFPPYIQYKGVIRFDLSSTVLKDYDALLFPTYYSGEGFAGTLIDSFSAGLPVISSNWRYNADLVNEGYTGLLYETHNVRMLEEKIEWLIKNKEDWNRLRYNCIAEAHNYLPQKVVSILADKMR